MRPKSQLPRGFTLIELLVVVAIIALLISMLLPALNGARNQAKQVLCLSNMDSIATAARLYASDNKDTFIQADPVTIPELRRYGSVHFVASLLPGLGQPENVELLFLRTPNGGTDTEQLHKVCKGTKLLQCPTFPQETQSLDYVVNAFRIPHRIGNQQISATTGPGPVSAPVNAIRSVMFNLSKGGRADMSKIIYVTEAHQEMPLPPEPDNPWPANHAWGQLIDVFMPNHMAFASQPRVANDQRHPGGITAAMFDGHAEVMPLRRLDPGPPATIFDRCRQFTYDEFETP